VRALPDDADDRDGYQQQYLDGPWEVTESTLPFRDGSVFLHVGVRRPIEASSGGTAGDGAVLGVDFGIENVAVTSTARFFDGGELRHRIEEYERTRSGLERTGTPSARETVARRSGRQHRYVRDVLHRVANGIIEDARRLDCSVIAVEDLEGIREEVEDAGRFHRWAYRRLRAFLEYETELTDIEVVAVKSRDPSNRCADCGHVFSYNRLSRGEFRCQRCETQANADYDAVKNIALQHPAGSSVVASDGRRPLRPELRDRDAERDVRPLRDHVGVRGRVRGRAVARRQAVSMSRYRLTA